MLDLFARLDPGGAPLTSRGPFTRGYHAIGAMPGGAIVTSGYEDFEIEAVDERLQKRWSAYCERKDAREQPQVTGLGSGAIVAGNSGARTVCSGGPKGSKNERSYVPPRTTGVFVTRLLDGGKIAWMKGSPVEGTFGGLAVSPIGRIALGVNTSTQAQVQVLDTDGKELFTARFTPERGETARIAALAINTAGSMVVAGDFEGALDAAGTRLVALGRDVFVARLAPDGALLWARRFGDQENQSAKGVAFDGAGGVVVMGSEAIRQSGDRSIEDWFVLDLLP